MSENMVICPVSSDREWAASERYERHYATPQELQENGGVCRRCREKFRKHNGGFISGRIETPAAMTHHVAQSDGEHAGFEALGPEQIIDFPFVALDGIEHDPIRTAADVFATVMTWVWGAGSIRSAMTRLAALTAALRPDLLGNKSYQQIGAELGVSKQSVARFGVAFCDEFGIQCARGRLPEARNHMRTAQLKSYEAGRRKKPRPRRVVIASQEDTNISHGAPHKESFQTA
jgi:hypothetical protein